MEVSGQLHDPAALPPGKGPLVAIDTRSGRKLGILKLVILKDFVLILLHVAELF
jgi:hypothetical protein